jgi:acyl-coenzyme A thioesterase PaaI-like protein
VGSARSSPCAASVESCVVRIDERTWYRAWVYTSAARLQLAATLRRLGHAVVSFQADDPVLEDINEKVLSLLPTLEASPERPHAFLNPGPLIFTTEITEGPSEEKRDAFPDCVISGRANPMGVAAHLCRDRSEAVCEVTLGAAFEGAPGRAHGGIVAALIDETMGLVLSIEGTPGFTGKLAITYRAPTPIGKPLEVRAHLAERNGRKLTIKGWIKSEGKFLAQAEGLFIAVDPEKFLSAD